MLTPTLLKELYEVIREMGNIFETCSLSRKTWRNISEPQTLETHCQETKPVIEPEPALETHTGKFINGRKIGLKVDF